MCTVSSRKAKPDRRRDSIALILLVAAAALVAFVWFEAAEPIGPFIHTLVGAAIGIGAYVVPVLLFAAAMVLMRTRLTPCAAPGSPWAHSSWCSRFSA